MGSRTIYPCSTRLIVIPSPEGCFSKDYGMKEVIELCVDYINELKPIGV
jgi:hypothetical protein